MPNPKPPYPAQFRQQMIDLVAIGRKPSELAREFGGHEASIISWMRAAKAIDGTPTVAPANSAALNAAERQELIELRRNNSRCNPRSGDAKKPPFHPDGRVSAAKAQIKQNRAKGEQFRTIVTDTL